MRKWGGRSPIGQDRGGPVLNNPFPRDRTITSRVKRLTTSGKVPRCTKMPFLRFRLLFGKERPGRCPPAELCSEPTGRSTDQSDDCRRQSTLRRPLQPFCPGHPEPPVSPVHLSESKSLPWSSLGTARNEYPDGPVKCGLADRLLVKAPSIKMSSMPLPVPRFREYFMSIGLSQCSKTPRLCSRCVPVA